MRQLADLLETSEAIEPQFFLRDDDIDVVEDSLVTLLGICQKHLVPVNLAVIPGGLTNYAAAFLREQLSKRPCCIELHQHGWKHVNHEPIGKKCEFGPSRSADEQFTDIAEGKARMDEAFGEAWMPAFTPPWNRCTDDTCRALERLDFSVLSTDRQLQATNYRFQQVPVTLDLYRWKGKPELRPAEEIIRSLLEQIKRGQTVGILLHHKVMNDEAFSFLDSLLETIGRLPRVKFHTFRSVASALAQPTAVLTG